jgi:hypothetical protein
LLHALRRNRFEADLAEELESHRAMKQPALEREGFERRESASPSAR